MKEIYLLKRNAVITYNSSTAFGCTTVDLFPYHCDCFYVYRIPPLSIYYLFKDGAFP